MLIGLDFDREFARPAESEELQAIETASNKGALVKKGNMFMLFNIVF